MTVHGHTWAGLEGGVGAGSGAVMRPKAGVRAMMGEPAEIDSERSLAPQRFRLNLAAPLLPLHHKAGGHA